MADTILDRFTTVDLGFPELAARPPRVGGAGPDDPDNVLGIAEPGSRRGEAVVKLASSRMFIRQDAEVNALAAAMEKNPAISAVGVVNEEGAPVGIVLRRELFDNLGRMHGRDLYQRKLVPTVMKTPQILRDDLSIFGVADTLGEELRKATSSFYVLVDALGRYSGIFSTTDMLIYLSDITSRDLALARRLQNAIVQESSQLAGQRTAILGASSMAKEVGGDFYVHKRLVGGRLLIAICDVSGKGIAASLITAVLGGFFDGYTTSNTLKTFVRSLNRYLCDTFRLEYFVTAIIIELDEETGEATICDMGHSYMLVMEGDKLMRLGSEKANPPLGVSPELAPVTCVYHMKPGGLAVLFTDGVIDQTDSDGQDYTERRLWGVLKAYGDLSPKELSAKLGEDLADFRGGEPQRDDITFVIMRYGGQFSG